MKKVVLFFALELLASNTFGLFSSSDTILASTVLHRVPEAIQLSPDEAAQNPWITTNVSQKTTFGSYNTDIPEDFMVYGTIIVRVPTNAAYLFIGSDDGWSQDNIDQNFDYAVEVVTLDTLLTVNASGSSIVIAWLTNIAGFVLQSAPAFGGTFTNIPGATTPYTNAITGGQQFFRLMHP